MDLQQSYVDAPLVASLTSNRGLWRFVAVRSGTVVSPSMDAPDNASISSNGSVPVVRCCRLSGLLVQPVVSEAAGSYGDPRIGSKSASQA